MHLLRRFTGEDSKRSLQTMRDTKEEEKVHTAHSTRGFGRFIRTSGRTNSLICHEFLSMMGVFSVAIRLTECLFSMNHQTII